MNLPLVEIFRLHPRGGGGIACDKAGVTLGAGELVRVGVDSLGRLNCEVAPPAALERVLAAAYGRQPEAVVLRLHSGLRRAAAAFEAGDLCLAGIETVLLRLPDLTRSALEKLAEVAKLEKWGTPWQDQPRVPAGQTGGGQWTTTGDVGGPPAVGAKPAARGSAQDPNPGQEPPPVDDGVYRPGSGDAQVTLTGGAEEEDPSRRSNGPPDDYTRLEDVFPGLRDAPGLAIPLAPVDGFLGASALADEANLDATMAQYRRLMADIKQVDPSFADQELLPSGGIAALSWQGRTNLINGLRMQRAADYYRVLGEVGPLQVETLRFLQGAVDAAYADAVTVADAGRLEPRLSREEAIGNRVDAEVRQNLKSLFNTYGIPFGSGERVTVNNRDYQTSENDSSYRIPDARLGDVAFDWTLSPKTISSPQIRGFFRSDYSRAP